MKQLIKNNIAVIAISICITMLIFPNVLNKIIFKLYNSEIVEISFVPNDQNRNLYFWGYGIGSYVYNSIDNNYYDNLNNKNNLEFLQQNPHARNYIQIKDNGHISVSIPITPYTWIGVAKGPDCSAVEIKYNGHIYNYDLYANTGHTPEARIYPFALHKKVAVKYIIYQALIAVAIFIFTLFTINILKYIINIIGKINLNNKFIPFIVTFILLDILFITWSKTDPTFLKWGDAVWYFDGYNAFLNNINNIDFNQFAQKSLFTPRAYILQFLIAIFYILSGYNHETTITIYLTFAALSLSLFTTVIVPKIYELSANKKANIIQITAFSILVITFWWNYIYNPLVDIYAVICLALFILFLLYFKLSSTLRMKIIYIFLAGMFLSLAALFRNNYSLVVYICIIYFLYKTIKNLLHKEILSFKLSSVYMLVLIIGILLPSIPQIYIGFIRDGVFAIYGYDKVGIYTSPLQTLTTQLASETLNWYSGWPIVLKNNFMVSQLAQSAPFIDVNHMSLFSVLSLYLENPLYTLYNLLAKIFIAIDIKTIITYHENTFGHMKNIWFLSIINYIIWAVFIFSIINKNVRNCIFNYSEKLFIVFIFIFVTLPSLVFHVEWRFFLLLYIFTYYIVSFKFISQLKDKTFTDILLKNHALYYVMGIILLMHFISGFLYTTLR